jgi:photosystem II stability/assembly factor-like uncharacterized protein
LILLLATADGLVVYESDRKGWHKTGHKLIGERVNSVIARADVILVGTTNGVQRSSDLGKSWQDMSAGLTTRHIRWLDQAQTVPGVMYAGTEPAGIFVSRDGAETWQGSPDVSRFRQTFGWYLPYSPAAGCVRDFAFQGTQTYAAVEVGGVLHSDDGGNTWQLVKGSSGNPDAIATPPKGFVHPDVHSIAVHPASPNLLYAPTGGGLYRSRNGGIHWECIYKCYCRDVWLDPRNPDHIILGPADGVDRNGRIEVSRDGGQTWNLASTGLDIPWQRHVVERIYCLRNELLAILSNGELIAAPMETLSWRSILPGVKDSRALATFD